MQASDALKLVSKSNPSRETINVAINKITIKATKKINVQRTVLSSTFFPSICTGLTLRG